MATLAQPHWILRDRPLFAVLHRPVGVARGLGVVLCKPFGYEMMCADRAYRHLAQALSRAGFPTLRMDYDGTGDSTGGDSDPDRVPSWLASIDAGVAAIERCGVRRVALVGVRFGALLAAEYAKRRPVDALVLVAPLSGRAYVRELRAFQSLRPPPGGAQTALGSGAPEEAVGFYVSAETAEQLGRASIVGADAPASRVLIVARDDMDGPEARFVEELARLDVDVKLSRTPGYKAMMHEDPVKSVVPDAIWGEIVEWLAAPGADSPAVGLGPATAALGQTARVSTGHSHPDVLETIVNVDGMFGILSAPAERPRLDAPTTVLVNVGANHHVGCNRIYVEFARQWASLGLSVLRLDLVGLGETPATQGRRENDIYSDHSVVDTRRALDWLEQTGQNARFVVGGICSGAYVAYHEACRDGRVEGAMIINPLTFHWRPGDSIEVRARKTLKSSDAYRQAAMRLDTWIRAARGDVHLRPIARKLAALAWGRVRRSTAQWVGVDAETDVGRGLRRLCDRGARVILICGEDDGSRDVVAEHLGPNAGTLRGHPNFRFEVIANTDHTFSQRGARRFLRDRLTAYLLGATDVPAPHDVAPAFPLDAVGR
jgi:alpha-beta hydrolase superfamily lysophospholipase